MSRTTPKCGCGGNTYKLQYQKQTPGKNRTHRSIGIDFYYCEKCNKVGKLQFVEATYE